MPVIAIGSTNPVKVQAVKEALQSYPQYNHITISNIDVPSEVSEQPLSLEEMIRGAKNRAFNAYQLYPSCQYSFGIESGLFQAEGTHTGYLEACICCIYNGNKYATGLSCGFEIPPAILSHVLEHDIDLGQACYQSGISQNAKLGSAEGLIGLLTGGRINRKEYTKQCVLTALIQIENPAHYLM